MSTIPECEHCIKERLDKGEQPAKLVELKVKTARHNKEVIVCEYCDGGLLELHLRSNQ